jgi:hypothetical protein
VCAGCYQRLTELEAFKAQNANPPDSGYQPSAKDVQKYFDEIHRARSLPPAQSSGNNLSIRSGFNVGFGIVLFLLVAGLIISAVVLIAYAASGR